MEALLLQCSFCAKTEHYLLIFLSQQTKLFVSYMDGPYLWNMKLFLH